MEQSTTVHPLRPAIFGSACSEFLGMMLGVRRAGVTVAVGALQHSGVIDHAPGSIVVLDPAKLEAAACDCFGVVQREYQRLLG